MASSVDYSASYNHLDDVEDAMWTSVDGLTTVNNVKVKGQGLTLKDISGGAVLGVRTNDSVFAVWASTMDSNPLTEESKLTIGSVVYTVIMATLNSNGTQYRAVCRKHL